MDDHEYERRLARESEFLRHLKDRLRSAPPEQRNEILQLILLTEQRILSLMREHRHRQEQEVSNMEVALAILQRRQRRL